MLITYAFGTIDLISLSPQTTKTPTGVLTRLVPRARLELAHPLGHGDLNAARLPIPPPGQVKVRTITSFFAGGALYSLATISVNRRSFPEGRK